MSSFTCLHCRVQFPSAEDQREHYRSDWHKYNLKRKVANMPPVTAENFQERLVAQQDKTLAQQAAENYSGKCKACGKTYSSENAYKEHLNSKKHKENAAKYVEPETNGDVEDTQKQPASTQSEAMDEDGDGDGDEEIEEVDDFDLTPNDCLFCAHSSSNVEENLKHMSSKHSFFIPDHEYLVDLDGLLRYLGLKIAQGHVCLFCNNKGRNFHSMDAVRKHMVEKGHTMVGYDEFVQDEFDDFYDFSSSYPDYDPNNPEQREMEVGRDGMRIGEDGSLILPDGKALGHREMKRYYDQSLKPESAQLVQSKVPNKHAMKAIGYGKVGRPITTREKYAEMHRVSRHSHWWMNVGIKANTLQRHFRPQVDF